MTTPTPDTEAFRDQVSTVDAQGKRVWLFPKKPSGKWFNRRKWVSYSLLAFLFAAPHLTLGGEQLVMLNVIERKFSFFGLVFYPQDMHIFAIAMVTLVLAVTFFTVVLGRLFCGWVCPQTIFMEMVFRRIEYWIEGDANAQRKLRAAPMSPSKFRKRALKHTLFWLISFAIANTFLAYLISSQGWRELVTSPPAEHLAGLTSMVVFTTVFYLVFSRFREQVCTVVCPYGRLQSVLLDRHSLVVAYDHVRGETRGRIQRGEDRSTSGKGDCIDCGLCVAVCPTGIDIRNGTQLECTNCTACIDACDQVMDKIGLEPNLVGYASAASIESKTAFSFTTKAKAYLAVFTGLMVVLGFVVVGRNDVEATILRSRGTLFERMDADTYSNVYDWSLLNKTSQPQAVTLKIEEGPGTLVLVGDGLELAPRQERHGQFLIEIDDAQLDAQRTELTIGVYIDDRLVDRQRTTFIGPFK